jgi:ATP-dependent Lhr-like helicase
MKLKDLTWAHPLVAEWFISKFGQPTEPQIQGWPAILAGKHTLISAPTGSGKTFAAFLICLNSLVKKALAGRLADVTEVLYVSPLKALSNDIQKNLLAPLQEIIELAKKKGLIMQEIRVAVRTGDTLQRERQLMLKHPPHILVTTPESFYILLTAEKSRKILQTVNTVIVDEIHALANNKRGAHLSLSLERLEVLTHDVPIRIGLSATQKPLEKVGHFLVGNRSLAPVIINIGHAKQLELAIEIPDSELSAVAANETWDEIYNRISELSQDNRSTLVFVNTRRLAERVAHHLAERIGEEFVTAHHGSLSRKLRLQAEIKLKNGELKVLVATASLELGIDIGSVDLVCQIGSPRSIAVMLQRAGRAGHWHGAISKAKIFVTTRDELVECASLIHAIRTGDLDQLIFPHEPLDILAQQIVASCATQDWHEKELYNLVKKSYFYKDLSLEEFDRLLTMLSEGIAGSRGRYGTYLFRDQVNHLVKARRGSRMLAITNGGAIPDNGLFSVIAEPQEVLVGTLDEDFAIESNRGDIILLGTTSWKIIRIEARAGRVLVEDAKGAPPTVPFWVGEAPGRTIELSAQVSHLREKINNFLPDKSQASEWLQKHCGLGSGGAEQLVEYINQGRALLGAVPTQKTIIAERFFDESGGMQLIIHAPFGSRINKAWGLALRKKFCRSFNFELQAAATDDGINIALAEQHSFPLSDVFHFVHPNTAEEVIVQAVLQSPLFPTRWRWDATRALALLRFSHGKKVPPNIQRMRSDDLLAAVFPDAAACQDNLGGRDIELPDHPLIREAMKDALHEALDVDGLKIILEKIFAGEIQCLAVDTPTPSVFSHEILNANPYAFLDDAPLEERRARAVEMRRTLPEKILNEIGKLDPAAIEEVEKQVKPDIRNADELHDFMQTIIALPEEHNEWQSFKEQLMAEHRIGFSETQVKKFWFAAEKQKIFSSIYEDLSDPAREENILQMIRGWMQHQGPTTSHELADKLSLQQSEVDLALLKLENSGQILRGQFRQTAQLEWCERRILARIHYLTLGRLRKQIEPVSPAQFMQWLLKWQHIEPGTQLTNESGLLELIRQLQGFEIPANAWEREIFPNRMKHYSSMMLDQLCLSGVVGWGRLSPNTAEQYKKIKPSSVSPITFFIREESDWVSVNSRDLANLSHIAQNVHAFLKQKGASFFPDITKGVGHLKAEVETALWELVAAGWVTADSFDNLRALIDSRRRAGRRGARKPRFCTGRWSLLHSANEMDKNQHLEANCWLLLKRYGIVFRDLLSREKNIPRWRELLVMFRRLEDRGEIRGGRFVSGFLGEQFALPYAVDSLRAIKNQKIDNEKVMVSTVDPLNLVGIILPGERVTAISGKMYELFLNCHSERSEES